MASICDVTCGASATPPTAYDADCITSTAKAGAEYFFTIACDLEIDLTNSILVGDAITAGTIKKSPRGKLLPGRGDETIIEDAYGCGDSLNVGYDMTLDYETYQAEPDSNLDDTYWATINDNANSLRVFWVSCSGKIYYDAGAANPGFKYSVSNRFLPEAGEQNFVKWTGQLEISDLTESIIPLYDAAVLDALGVSIN